jgi:hypothetical protein
MDLGATIAHARAKLPTQPAPTGSEENVNRRVDGIKIVSVPDAGDNNGRHGSDLRSRKEKS